MQAKINVCLPSAFLFLKDNIRTEIFVGIFSFAKIYHNKESVYSKYIKGIHEYATSTCFVLHKLLIFVFNSVSPLTMCSIIEKQFMILVFTAPIAENSASRGGSSEI